MILAATVIAALAVLWFVAPAGFGTRRDDN
jgi:hypothetical protein